MLQATIVSVTTCCLWCCGCGTFADAMSGPLDDHLYYRGVRMDIRCIQDHEDATRALMAIDIPVSAVVDTLLVPYIAYLEYCQSHEKDRTSQSTSSTQQPERNEAQRKAQQNDSKE